MSCEKCIDLRCGQNDGCKSKMFIYEVDEITKEVIKRKSERCLKKCECEKE